MASDGQWWPVVERERWVAVGAPALSFLPLTHWGVEQATTGSQVEAAWLTSTPRASTDARVPAASQEGARRAAQVSFLFSTPQGGSVEK